MGDTDELVIVRSFQVNPDEETKTMVIGSPKGMAPELVENHELVVTSEENLCGFIDDIQDTFCPIRPTESFTTGFNTSKSFASTPQEDMLNYVFENVESFVCKEERGNERKYPSIPKKDDDGEKAVEVALLELRKSGTTEDLDLNALEKISSLLFDEEDDDADGNKVTNDDEKEDKEYDNDDEKDQTQQLEEGDKREAAMENSTPLKESTTKFQGKESDSSKSKSSKYDSSASHHTRDANKTEETCLADKNRKRVSRDPPTGGGQMLVYARGGDELRKLQMKQAEDDKKLKRARKKCAEDIEELKRLKNKGGRSGADENGDPIAGKVGAFRCRNRDDHDYDEENPPVSRKRLCPETSRPDPCDDGILVDDSDESYYSKNTKESQNTHWSSPTELSSIQGYAVASIVGSIQERTGFSGKQLAGAVLLSVLLCAAAAALVFAFVLRE